MDNQNNIWQSHKTTISFTIMALLLLFVGFNQSWALVLGIFNLCLISAIMALGVNIQWGYAGLFNVGIMGFAALGGISVVLISQQPVAEAIEVGGLKMLFALILGALTIFIGVFLNRRGYNKWLIALVVIIGYLATRYYFSNAADLIEKVNPAKTGYLGGLGMHVMFSWIAGGLAAAAAAWSIIGMLNLISKLSGASGRKCFTQASRVGIQCLTEGVNLQTAKIFVRCSSSWTSPESCHRKTFDFLELINNAMAPVQSSCLMLANLLYCAFCTT